MLVDALRALEGGPSERAAIEAVERAVRLGRAPEALRVTAARIAVQRAELDRALLLLDAVNEAPSRVLKAEVYAARGELAQACTVMGEALAMDVTIPGAWDRLRRWRATLGVGGLGGVGGTGGIFGAGGDRSGDDLATSRTDPTLLLPSDRATPFRIIGEAGRGGTATVYEAMDDVLGRRVALKVYHQPSVHRVLIEREARIAARLAGPGVVAVLDTDYEKEAGWIALEWAALGPLRAVIARGERAVLNPVRGWVIPLVDVLVRMHRAGWIHGDVKPGNLLFLVAGQVVLSDFGLTRQPGEPWVGGTPAYSSPERLAGRPAHPDDDVFALGRLLHDVLDLIELADRPWVLALADRCMRSSGERPESAEQIWL